MAFCACHREVGGAAGAHGSPANPAANLYRPPPEVTNARPRDERHVQLTGKAEPGARVRLASPNGQAVFASSARDGVWRIQLPAPGSPRLFGLAMIDGQQVVQSEGYVAVTPTATAAQLRAGAGAVVLGGQTTPPSIDAVDFDSKGGTVVSGRGVPHSEVDILVDGVRRAHGFAMANGQVSLALDEPLAFTQHRLEIVAAGRRASARVSVTPPARLAGVPYRSDLTPAGWRIDWITPGGGLQTTLLISHEGSAG